MSSCICLISARGGSKGLPRKNLRLLGGKPLIVWTIVAARASTAIQRVIVSTDDEEIARVSREAGAEVPFLRPLEIARDDSPHILTSEHAIRWLHEHDGVRPDYMMLLQPTSPFRTSADIDAAVALARQKEAIAVVSVNEAKPHPYKTYGLTSSGALTTFVPCDIVYKRRQDLPPAFADNGALYLNRTDSLLRDRTYIPTGTIPYVMPAERSLDIDSAWDLFVADLIIRNLVSGTTDRGWTEARL
jgi:CMP-N,N'-diacetyllegionaminic acid synthase